MRIVFGLLSTLLLASWANAQIIYPSGIKINSGTLSSTDLSVLRVQDQSGQVRDAKKYIYFTPNKAAVSVDFTFTASPQTLKSIALSSNYRGPTLKAGEWAYSLYNVNTKAYDKIANNSAAKSWTWTSLKGTAAVNASNYISSSGAIVLRYTSVKTSDGSALDYLALTLAGGGTTPQPSPSPTIAPSPSPTIAPSPSPTVVPSPSPTVVPTPKPTVVPSPSPTVVPSPSPTVVPSPTPAPTTAPTRAFNGVRPYGPSAPWNIPVANLPVHPESKKYADALWADFLVGNIPELNFRKYTYAVYDATKATDMYVIKDRNNWGNLNGKTIPFNPGWLPNAGTDAQAVILDAASGKEWNLWDMAIDTSAKQITISNGNLCPGDYLTNNWDNKATKCTGSRGVGINYLAMLVRPWEIEKGVIEHALSMPIIGTSGQSYVAPATKLEHPGKVGAIPEGMRFALNVTYAEIDTYLNSLGNISAAKKRALRIIFVALKDYGWFITDTAGGHALQFEAPESAQADWERIGVLPGQSVGGVEHPRYSLQKFITKDRIITIIPSDQYPK
jgi:hypothetical protein